MKTNLSCAAWVVFIRRGLETKMVHLLKQFQTKEDVTEFLKAVQLSYPDISRLESQLGTEYQSNLSVMSPCVDNISS